jgi:3-dehydro-L-gulonate 2-dehydrogenase
MAVSQYSFGKIQEYKFRDEHLPFPGGYDQEGELTRDPVKIIETQRALPIGYWKGSGLSLLVDVLLTALSGGRSTGVITGGGSESGVSQCFIAIKQGSGNAALVEQILDFTKLGHPEEVRYPGESTLSKRNKHATGGIPVNERIWNDVLNL